MRSTSETFAKAERDYRIALAKEIVRQHVNGSNSAAREWLGGLTDPGTGQAWFPDSWAQRVLQDNRLSPQDRAGLISAHRNLIANGNPSQSDPDVVHDLLSRAALAHNDPANPSVSEVYGHAGNALTLADAQFIAGRSGPQDPLTDAATSRISEVLAGARQQIGNPSAFGRFVNWLLPTMRAGGSLDPNAQEFALTPERMASFQPTGDDIIAPAVGARGFAMRGEAQAAGTRTYLDADGAQHTVPVARMQPSLGDIFSGAWKGALDLPGAVARGVEDASKEGIANPNPAAVAQRAYANPLPVQGENGPTQNPPHSPTMADMAEIDPKDLELPERGE